MTHDDYQVPYCAYCDMPCVGHNLFLVGILCDYCAQAWTTEEETFAGFDTRGNRIRTYTSQSCPESIVAKIIANSLTARWADEMRGAHV